MNKREAAIVTAYTGILTGSFSEFHEYAEEIMGRAIWTHEFGNNKVTEELKIKSKEDFVALSKGITI